LSRLVIHGPKPESLMLDCRLIDAYLLAWWLWYTIADATHCVCVV